MEEGREARSLLDGIKPPRIEDAGLEDCALPPESIREAFLKAASAVGSLISVSDDGDESGSEDQRKDGSDPIVGIKEWTTEMSPDLRDKGMDDGDESGSEDEQKDCSDPIVGIKEWVSVAAHSGDSAAEVERRLVGSGSRMDCQSEDDCI